MADPGTTRLLGVTAGRMQHEDASASTPPMQPSFDQGGDSGSGKDQPMASDDVMIVDSPTVDASDSNGAEVVESSSTNEGRKEVCLTVQSWIPC